MSDAKICDGYREILIDEIPNKYDDGTKEETQERRDASRRTYNQTHTREGGSTCEN